MRNKNKNQCSLSIIKLRKALKLTQDQLASQLDLDQRTISGYESGRRLPCASARSAIYKFAKKKGVEIKLEHLCNI